jgi:hypothetical protein
MASRGGADRVEQGVGAIDLANNIYRSKASHPVGFEREHQQRTCGHSLADRQDGAGRIQACHLRV